MPHFSGSVQGLRALEAGREVLRLNQLCVRILGDDAGIFKFVDVSISADEYHAEILRRKTNALAHTSYAAHFIPTLRNAGVRVDDNATLKDAVTALAGAMDEIESNSLKEAAGLAHHARRGVAISAMAKMLASVVMREVRTTARDKIKQGIARRAAVPAAAAAAASGSQ